MVNFYHFIKLKSLWSTLSATYYYFLAPFLPARMSGRTYIYGVTGSEIPDVAPMNIVEQFGHHFPQYLHHDFEEYIQIIKKRPVIFCAGINLFCGLFGVTFAAFYLGEVMCIATTNADGTYINVEYQSSQNAMWYVVVIGFFVVSLLLSALVSWILVAKYRHEKLLRSMFPGNVVEKLETGNESFAESYENVTLFFSDIVNFTPMVSKLQPAAVVEILHELYCLFDNLALKHDIYKVETIGDAYMAVAGCPSKEDPVEAATKVANFAMDVVAAVRKLELKHQSHQKIQIRIGIHSGPVMAGVVGKKMPRFCLFGDTVNTASRMETTSEAMRVHVSSSTAELLERGKSRIHIRKRGKIHLKGKGEVTTFWLEEDQQPVSGGCNYRATTSTSSRAVGDDDIG